jgi:hypothetical protein
MSAPSGPSIRARLLLVLGLALALVTASALLGWWQSRQAARIAQSLYDDRLVPVDLLRDIEQVLGAQQLGTLLISQAQEADGGRMGVASQRVIDSSRQAWTRYLATRMSPPELALIARVQPQLDQLWAALAQAGEPTPELLREINQRRLAVMRLVDELMAFQLSQARIDTERAQEAATDAARLGLLLVLLSAAVCGVLVCLVWARYDEERRAGDASRLRLQQLYIALSKTNQLIVRREAQAVADEHAEQHLFQDICRICVETGHARFASVVLTEGDAFERVAESGPGDRLIPGAPRRWSRESPFARASMATRAIIGGVHQVSNHAVQDPTLVVPGAPVIPPGVEAMAAFPLHRGGEIIGALSVLAGEEGFFDPQVLGLMDEMAGDLSFALEYLQRERDQAIALHEAREALRHYRSDSQITAPASFRASAGESPDASPEH